MNDTLWRDTVFHIVCVAGQSNAAGFDESPVNFRPEDAPARIFQLGYWGEDNLKSRPLLPCAQNFQDMRPFGHPDSTVPGAKGIHLPLARLLLPLIPPGDALLILPCAYGGTGFTVNEIGPYDDQALRPAPGAWRWGVSSNYYRALRDRIAWVLDQNPENRFFRMIWCQGEHDKDAPDAQIAAFDDMTADFFSFFSARYPGRVLLGDWNRSVWFNYETTAYWYQFPGCRDIWAHYRAWSPDTYVPIPRDTDTNAVGGTGLTARVREAHFGNGAFETVIAPAVAVCIMKSIPADSKI